MPVSKDDAARLAELASAIRPHGARRWDKVGVVAAIAKVAHLNLADVAMAVIRAADDRTLDTPGAIANPKAPCWADRRGDRPQPPDPYDPNRFCHVCGRSNHPGPSDHAFETEVEYRRRLANEAPKPPIRELASRLDEGATP